MALRFTRAIVRPPSTTFAAGVTTASLGPPDLVLALEQHETYCSTLEGLGLSLLRLAPDPDFPDSTFIEDTAVITSAGAILTRPGATTRTGEVASVAAALTPWFPAPPAISAPGTLDGGDVCQAGEHFFIGRSRRTNGEGAAQLAAWLAQQGFTSSEVDIRGMPELLHLKTGLSWLGERRLLAVRRVAEQNALSDWETVPVPAGEDYAANCIRVNDAVLLPEGFAATSALLGRLGYSLVPLGMSEYRKMDGGPSCLSLRW